MSTQFKVLMSRALLAASALTAVGCGQTRVLELGEYAPYVGRFEDEAKARALPVVVDDLKIVAGKVDDPQRDLAVCEIHEGETPKITINEGLWELSSETQREQTLFHELGHCVLRRMHDAQLDDDGLPESLMHPLRLSAPLYEERRVGYMDELFSHNNEF